MSQFVTSLDFASDTIEHELIKLLEHIKAILEHKIEKGLELDIEYLEDKEECSFQLLLGFVTIKKRWFVLNQKTITPIVALSPMLTKRNAISRYIEDEGKPFKDIIEKQAEKFQEKYDIRINIFS